MDYFTQEHFDLLNEWAKKKYDKKEPLHTSTREELKTVYKLVEDWAHSLNKSVFADNGRVKLVKNPVNQGQKFESYLWARIYPKKDSPKELAYTIGFNTEGLDIKIDTVGLDESKDKRRKKYLEARGDFDSSGIVSLMPIEDAIKLNLEQVLTWSKQQMESFDMGYDEVANKMGLNDDESTTSGEPIANGSELNSVTPLNQILYGPPGTGKTYHTVQASVKAAEPNFKAKSRVDLKKKYDELVAEKRIRFVTFHQSYGYEEFVEGLRASSDQGQVSYDVEPGIFKQICDQASQGVEPDSDPLEQALEKFKVELEEVSVIKLKTLRGKEFNVQFHGNNTFRVFPEATTVDDLGNGYAVSIDNIRKLYRDGTFKKFYNPSYVKAILNHLKVHYEVKDFKVPTSGQIKNFVLIIDEINRGNISKIFGELITLIEDTKRSGEGQDETLEVVLPNSGDSFTVPNNLYLIGTMNTADRSLAMMDTALRRRFDFVEMMPKPELFNNVIVKEIDLEALLYKMNQRIEVLYDREHTLGHAFFMPVKALVEDQDKAFNELKSVFKNKIIPLLEEYFFEDWNKIRLVLGDNQKAEDLQFVSEEKQSFDSLFGNDHGLNSYEQEEKSYRLLPFDDDGVWDKPEAYIGIYKAKKAD